MLLTLEIALGVFLGLGAFAAFSGWRANRIRQRRLEAQMNGLTTDQLRMLRDVRDPAEFDRMVSNMHEMNRRVAELSNRQISN